MVMSFRVVSVVRRDWSSQASPADQTYSIYNIHDEEIAPHLIATGRIPHDSSIRDTSWYYNSQCLSSHTKLHNVGSGHLLNL